MGDIRRSLPWFGKPSSAYLDPARWQMGFQHSLLVRLRFANSYPADNQSIFRYRTQNDRVLDRFGVLRPFSSSLSIQVR
jgi:hypothetical protein